MINQGIQTLGTTLFGSWSALLLWIGVILLAYWLLKYKIIK